MHSLYAAANDDVGDGLEEDDVVSFLLNDE